MTLLVRTPSPHPTESLLGYALRVSEENGYDTPWHIFSLSGMVPGQMLTAGFPVEKLADVLGVGAETLTHIAYQALAGTERHFKILGHHLGQGLNGSPFRLSHPAFCPQCVVEQGHIDAFWDLSAAVACPRHGTYALRACPSCNAALSWFRPGLLTCKCGAALDEADASPASQELRALMAIFQSKLQGMPLVELDNPCRFALQQLDKIPLGSLLQIAHGLGHWNIKSQSHNALGDEYVFLAAAESLQDWPTGFHGMLHRLGEQAIKDGVEGAGLRKQFSSFYVSMLKRRDFTPDAGFLREEFVSFGKFHWGHALVDAKLLRGQNALQSDSARFISKNEFAKRYGLRVLTMGRLILSGAISTKRISTGKSVRILIDLEQSRIPVESRGVMTVRDAARQAGLPVSVLQWARKVGVFGTKVRNGNESSWHQDDVDQFIERGLALAPLSTTATGGQGVTVSAAMRLNLRNDDAKGDIIGAMFDGRLSVISRSGDNFSGLILDGKELDEFVRIKRIAALNHTYSTWDIARKTGLDPMVVAAAMAAGMLKTEIVDGRELLTRSSFDSFHARYIPLVKLATELGTSTRTLLRCCNQNDIPVISLKRKTTGVPQPVLLRANEGRMRAVWAERLAHRAIVEKRSNQGEATQVALLGAYLAGLTQSGERLPRLASKPNRTRIAKATGFSRNMFYAYPVLVEMLDVHDATERGLVKCIPVDPLVAIQKYLGQLRANNLPLPVGQGGEPNIRAISKACGCHRNIFHNKAYARRLLSDFTDTTK